LEKLINGLAEKFEAKTIFADSSYQVQLREKSTSGLATSPLHISLFIDSDGKTYKLECFEVKNVSKNEEELSRLHSIKVEGQWDLKKLELDLFKILRREYKTFKAQYHPF